MGWGCDMTREEGQQYVRDMTTGHHKDATSNHYNDIKKAVDKIYDDFEIRTCENCKYGYLEEEHLILCNASFYDDKIYDSDDDLLNNPLFYPNKDFGCNKWEAK